MNYPQQQDKLEDFWDDLSDWSQSVFGTDQERNERGPLLHLQKEVQEALDATFVEEKQKEIVDCLFLVFDAARRSGLQYWELVEGAFEKLEVNKKRKWGPKSADKPTEHIREGE